MEFIIRRIFTWNRCENLDALTSDRHTLHIWLGHVLCSIWKDTLNFRSRNLPWKKSVNQFSCNSAKTDEMDEWSVYILQQIRSIGLMIAAHMRDCLAKINNKIFHNTISHQLVRWLYGHVCMCFCITFWQHMFDCMLSLRVVTFS